MYSDEFIKKFVIGPKISLLQSFRQAAFEFGAKFSVVVATDDGGVASGIPKNVVQGAFTILNVTQGTASRRTSINEETGTLECELRFNGTPTLLNIDIGLIAGVLINDEKLPFKIPYYASVPVEVAPQEEDLPEGVVSLSAARNKKAIH